MGGGIAKNKLVNSGISSAVFQWAIPSNHTGVFFVMLRAFNSSKSKGPIVSLLMCRKYFFIKRVNYKAVKSIFSLKLTLSPKLQSFFDTAKWKRILMGNII